MDEPPKPRKILSLKNPPTRPLGPQPLRPPALAPPPPPAWKCKPCGAGLDVAKSLEDQEVVRCPACNAKLGKAGDFRADPTPDRLRARKA